MIYIPQINIETGQYVCTSYFAGILATENSVGLETVVAAVVLSVNLLC